ncbi:MAG: biotin/lipoyl-binding protein, partial [Gammaproteobacteria bacterium]
MARFLRVMLGVAALALLGVVLAYFAGAFGPKVPQSVPSRTFSIDGEPYTVSPTEAPVAELVPGTIQATDETIISSRILANVLHVNVRAGDQVAQGKLLVELDGEALAAVLEQRTQETESAAAVLEEAQLTRERVTSLYESGNASKSEYDRAIA